MRSLLVSGVCRSLLAGALLSAGAGCANESDNWGDVTEVPEGVNGELVYALALAPGHTVQFFEFEKGERAGAIETMAVGDTSCWTPWAKMTNRSPRSSPG